jgi:hypothetical protein
MMKKVLFLIASSVMTFSILVGCGNDQEESIGVNEQNHSSGAEGTQLAGQQSPALTGELVGEIENDMVKVNVEGKVKTFRLSEDAKSQLSKQLVKVGDAVTFTTFSIGDTTLTIDSFLSADLSPLK